MKNLFITGDAPGFPRPEPAEVYQEAALSLRYKRITAITAVKLQRAMALLQLEPHVLVERGLASMSSLERNLEYGEEQGKQLNTVADKRNKSPSVVSSCLQVTTGSISIRLEPYFMLDTPVVENTIGAPNIGPKHWLHRDR